MSTKVLLALMVVAALTAIGLPIRGNAAIPQVQSALRRQHLHLCLFRIPWFFRLLIRTRTSRSVLMRDACRSWMGHARICGPMAGHTRVNSSQTYRAANECYVYEQSRPYPAAGEMTVHNHGNHSSAVNDGQPDTLLIPTGGSRIYTYEGIEEGNNQRGKMQFYHDHRMDVTGRNVWMGLTGLYIVDDPADPQTLPAGEFDLPLVIADRQFDVNNQIPYVFNPNGVTGDKFLINGVYQPYLEAGDRKYRFRILNASNFRTYFLELSSGDSLPKSVRRAVCFPRLLHAQGCA